MRATLRVVAILSLSGAASAEPATAHFTKRPARVGDAVEQAVEATMDLSLRSRRGAAVLESEQVASRRRQHRRVVATGLDGGRAVRATVHFFEAETTRDDQTANEPVVGKSYQCVREGDELRITDGDGAVPPFKEFAFVARAMDSLGKPNPLADYLSGRSLAVGERIDLPPEVARGALGFDERMGDVDRFALVLKAIEGDAVANFHAEVEATGAGSSQMRALLTGPLRVEIGTCRVVGAELSGPVGLIETRGSVGRVYQIDGAGVLGVTITARYDDAESVARR